MGKLGVRGRFFFVSLREWERRVICIFFVKKWEEEVIAMWRWRGLILVSLVWMFCEGGERE